MATRLTRAELDSALDRLASRIPELVQECRPEDVLEGFAGEAEYVEDNADPADCDYLHSRINCMLASAGLIPGDNEGESCG